MKQKIFLICLSIIFVSFISIIPVSGFAENKESVDDFDPSQYTTEELITLREKINAYLDAQQEAVLFGEEVWHQVGNSNYEFRVYNFSPEQVSVDLGVRDNSIPKTYHGSYCAEDVADKLNSNPRISCSTSYKVGEIKILENSFGFNFYLDLLLDGNFYEETYIFIEITPPTPIKESTLGSGASALGNQEPPVQEISEKLTDLPATPSELTLETIFEDEALAMCIRDKLAKFSIKQPVTQAELDSVTSIQVFSSNDYGKFTSLKGIGYLRNLKTLGLYNSCCSGISELPDDFFKLTVLSDLDLSGSAISEIPEEFGQLVNLKNVEIDRTGITSLPDSIGNLINLTSLDVSHTGITTLPSTLANCTSLKKLDISYTAITELPEAIYSLNLDSLTMQGLPIK